MKTKHHLSQAVRSKKALTVSVALLLAGSALLTACSDENTDSGSSVESTTTTSTTAETTTTTRATTTTTTEATTTETTTTTTSDIPYTGDDYSQYESIGLDLTYRYEDILNIYTYGTTYDESDMISFRIPEYEDAYDHYGVYCRNTDKRFNSIEDIENYAKSVLSRQHFDQLLAGDLTADFTDIAVGDTIESETAKGFIMYNGKLYVHIYERVQPCIYDYKDDAPIHILNVTEDSFVAVRDWYIDVAHTETYSTRYTIVRDTATGEWRLDSNGSIIP